MKMMSRFFVLGLLFYSIGVYAGPGFFLPEAKDAPHEILGARSAVYRYAIFASDPTVVPETSYADELLKRKNRGNYIDLLSAHEILDCQAAKLKICEVHFAGSGTAFVVGPDRDHLLTVNHNLNWDKASYDLSLKSGERQDLQIHVGPDQAAISRNMFLSFVLFDSEGRIAFDTRFSGDSAYPELLGSGLMVNWTKSMLGDDAVDFAYIKLNRPVGETSLELSDTPPVAGETLSTLGFPEVTGSRRVLENKLNSDGISQFYSPGAVMPNDVVLKFMNGPEFLKDPEAELSDLRDKAPQIFFTDGECVSGFSGSPLINRQGKVAGLVVSKWNKADQPFYLPNNLIALKASWIAEMLQKYAP